MQQEFQDKRQKRHIPMRWIIFAITGLFIVIGAVLWILNGDNGEGHWSSILSVIFVIVGILVSLLQWLFPVPADNIEKSSAPAFSTFHTESKQMQHSLHTRPLDRLSSPFNGHSYHGILGLPPPTDASMILQRTNIVREIYLQFTTSAVSAITLIGIGGVGKSTLAALICAYVEQQLRNHNGPFTVKPLWLVIDKHVTMIDLVGTLFCALEKPLPDLEHLTPQNQALALFHALNEVGEGQLIVLDQFENFLDWQTGQVLPDRSGVGEFVDAMNNQSCHSKLLLTSRLRPRGIRVYPPTFMQTYSVTGFAVAEGVELLRKLGVVTSMATDVELQTAVVQCEGHPLAMILLASLLLRNHGIKLTDLLEESSYAIFWRGDVARNLLDYIYKQQLGLRHRQLLCAFAVYRQAVALEAALALLDIDSRDLWQESVFALEVLLAQHLLQALDGARYQSHAIIAVYAKEHFVGNEGMAGKTQLLEAHGKAAIYYLQLASTNCPSRSMRKYVSHVQPFIEAIWHFCQAERWREAYHVMEQENIYEDLRRWGGNNTLLELYRLLLPMSKWHPERVQEAAICSGLGRVSGTSGQKEQALRYYEDALRLYREIGQRHGEAGALNHLGSLHENLGCYEQAIADHQQALSIYRDIGDRKGEGNSLNGLAWIYHHRRREEEALECYKRALSIRLGIKHHIGVSDTLDGLGLIYYALDKYDLALKHMRRALVVRRKVGDRGGEGRTLNHLGLVYASIGQSAKAYDYYRTSLTIRKEVGDRNGEGVVFYNIGKLCFQNHHNKESLACFLIAQNIFKEVQSAMRDAPQAWIDRIRKDVGNEQFMILSTDVEPRAIQIVEQALLNTL